MKKHQDDEYSSLVRAINNDLHLMKDILNKKSLNNEDTKRLYIVSMALNSYLSELALLRYEIWKEKYNE